MAEKRKLVHGWRNGRPVVGFEDEIVEANYKFSGRSMGGSLIKESCLITRKFSNNLCVSPLNNGYYMDNRRR